MQAGKLSDTVLFQTPVVTGSHDTYTTTWTDAFTLPAEVRRDTEMIARFTIRYRDGITPASHRMIWDGILWRITSAVHDRKRTLWTIDADGTPLVDSTELTDETTHYVDAVPIMRPRE